MQGTSKVRIGRWMVMVVMVVVVVVVVVVVGLGAEEEEGEESGFLRLTVTRS